jgi:hypothetical protein
MASVQRLRQATEGTGSGSGAGEKRSVRANPDVVPFRRVHIWCVAMLELRQGVRQSLYAATVERIAAICMAVALGRRLLAVAQQEGQQHA